MTRFQDLRIGIRLTLAFGIVLALAASIAGIGVWQLSKVAHATQTMMELPVRKERLISDLARLVSVDLTRTTVIARSVDTGLARVFAEDAASLSRTASGLMREIEPLLASEEEKRLYAQVMEERRAYIAARGDIMRLKAQGNVEEAARLYEGAFLQAARNYQALLERFVAAQRSRLDADAARVAAIDVESRRNLILLTIVAIGLGVLCAWRLGLGITRPLGRAVAVARRVADGDLGGSIEVTSRDETGQLLAALHDMTASLTRIVAEVHASTDTITTGAREIAAGNLDLSSRTEQQASSLEETAASMEELTATVKQNADNARHASELAAAAAEVAGKGGSAVAEVVETMTSINESARRIGDIIGVIDGIAFQTNILALNAAVEAARAGEQGRGFAVVASEVRNLAQRSAAAAREIKALIGESVDKAGAGARLVGAAGATMDEIVASIGRVATIVTAISAASREQASGIEQVNQAVGHMDQATQQNAALVEQAAAAASAMQEQAARLELAVSVFKVEAAAAHGPAALSRAVQTRISREPAAALR